MMLCETIWSGIANRNIPESIYEKKTLFRDFHAEITEQGIRLLLAAMFYLYPLAL